MSYQRAEVSEQYKQAVREYFRHANPNSTDVFRTVSFYEGRMSGLEVALSCLGVTSDEIREMYAECKEQIKDELEKEKRDMATASSLHFSPEFLKRRNEEQAKEWTAYCDECGKAFNSKDAVKVPYQEYPGAAFSDEQVSPCCGAGYSDRPKEEDDIYECEHCNAEFKASEILYHKYGGEIGTIAFCPRCYQATKLICVTDLVEARK